MLKLAGALLLMAGASCLGFGAAGQLKARVSCLMALCAALEQMERELTFRLTPMPELMGKLAKTAQAPADLFFARCREEMGRLGERSFGQLWRAALEEETELILEPTERQILASLGDVLGRYDAEGQRLALRTAGTELGECLRRAREERDRLGRVYATLGLGAGAMLVIILL